MITIHHLGVSQSDRIVWLMEELELPYELRWYDRGPDGMAPPEYRALHPAATAPVVGDGDLVLTESAVIVEYISHRHGGGRLSVLPQQPAYPDYLYWMHFNNNVLGLFFATLVARSSAGESPALEALEPRLDRYYRYLDQRLAEVPFLAGPELTCADIMVVFDLTTLLGPMGRTLDDLPHARAYVERISRRPAYRKAMEIAGPSARRPEA